MTTWHIRVSIGSNFIGKQLRARSRRGRSSCNKSDLTQDGFIYDLQQEDDGKTPVERIMTEDGIPTVRGRVLGGASVINTRVYTRANIHMGELKKLLCSSQTHFLGNLLYEKRFRRLVVLVLIMDSVWITIKELDSRNFINITLSSRSPMEAYFVTVLGITNNLYQCSLEPIDFFLVLLIPCQIQLLLTFLAKVPGSLPYVTPSS
ncbi:hypothetical protein ACFX15_012832 [Malus domestica]